MNIYELPYAAAVMCYRNIDALEERHVVCGKADEKLYSIICEEFVRRFDMFHIFSAHLYCTFFA